MVTKDMARSEWTRIRSKKQIILPCSVDGRLGKISLMKLLDVMDPFSRVYNGREIVLADNGYYWLQLAMENDHAWFTVMFDDQGKLLQIYVDITNGNHTEQDDPTFEDLFLDYVVYGDDVYELDRNELDEAYHSGSISDKQYKKAVNEGEKISRCLRDNLFETKKFFEDQYIMLRHRMEHSES